MAEPVQQLPALEEKKGGGERPIVCMFLSVWEAERVVSCIDPFYIHSISVPCLFYTCSVSTPYLLHAYRHGETMDVIRFRQAENMPETACRFST